MAEVGMISSIFGKTSAELEKERREAYQGLIQPLRGRTGRERDVEGVTNLLSVIARKYGEKKGGDPAMQKAKEAERKQAELSEYLSGIPAGDPRGSLAIAKAKASVGDMKGYFESMQTASLLERYAEQQREARRVREEKGADELSEALDREDLSGATLALAKNPNDENAIRTIVEISGNNAPNVFYAADRLRENMQGQDGLTKRQSQVTDKFVSGLSDVIDVAEYYNYFKSIYGDDFVVPESFLAGLKTDEKNTDDNGGNGGNPPEEGSANELGLEVDDYKKVDDYKLGIRQLKLPDINFTTYRDLYKNTNEK